MIRDLNVLPPRILTLFSGEIVLIAGSYVGGAFVTMGGGASAFLLDNGGWKPIAVATVILLLASYFRNLYSDLRVRSRILLVQELVLVMGALFMAEALMTYLNFSVALKRGVLIPGSGLALVSIYGWRLMCNAAVPSQVGVRRVLFLGFPPVAAILAKYLREHPQTGFAAVGYVDAADHPEQTELERVASPGDLRGVTERFRPDWIVIEERARIAARYVGELVEWRFNGVRIEDIDAFCERILGRVSASEIRPAELILSESFQPARFNVTLQSMYSTLAAVILLPLALPAIALGALAIRITRGSPVLLRETCLGMGGARFTTWRFRTRRFSRTVKGKKADGFAYRCGLDRLPQIWNVLRGEMSLVGPRPDRIEFAERLGAAIPYHAQRLAVRPGVFAWAELQQKVDGSERDAVKRFQYDLYYVKNLSPLLDVFVLLRWLRESVLSAAPQTEAR